MKPISSLSAQQAWRRRPPEARFRGRRRPFRHLPHLLLALVAAGCAAGDQGPIKPFDETSLRALLDDGEIGEAVRSALTSAATLPAPVSDGGRVSEPRDAGPGGLDGGFGTGGAAGGGTGGGAGGFAGRAGAGGGGAAGTIGCLTPGSGGTGGVMEPPPSKPSPGPARDAGAAEPGLPVCPAPGPLAQWKLDDCNAGRSDLRDSTFNGFTAYRSVGAKCVPAIDGLGLAFPGRREMAYVPDQPVFTFDEGVTVAAWIKPGRLGGDQTLVRKRAGGTSSFVLALVERSYVFVLDRVGAVPVAVSAAAQEDVWTHVAATYDGRQLRLFIDGVEAARAAAPGLVAGGPGPLLVGNDGDQRVFKGTIDEIVFDRRAASDALIKGFTCLRRPARMSIAPASARTEVGGTVSYELAISNDDAPSCAPEPFFISAGFHSELTISPSFASLSVAPGTTASVSVSVTSSPDGEAGQTSLNFLGSRSGRGETLFATASLETVAIGCSVSTRRELLVRDLSVVDDPARTRFAAPAGDPRRGAWSFAHLLRQMAPRSEEAPDLAEALFGSFLAPQTVNGFVIEARPAMRQLVLDSWPRTDDGKLDLEQAPVQLLAIVNRLDLRNLARGDAGEGRFVFGVLGPGGFPLEFTIILEYKLPAQTEADVLAWAQAWHGLGALPFPSEGYNAALQAITDRFVGRDARPGAPNGSALAQLRTNEIALGGIWEMREFTLTADGRLAPSPIKLTPHRGFDGSERLSRWVTANAEALLTETHEMADAFEGESFRGGAVFNDLRAWSVPGVSSDLRHKFSLNTCNGCHSSEETGTGFLHVGNRFPGNESFLSGFMTGTTVFDPVTGEARQFNDLGRRNRDLRALVCPSAPPPPVTTTPDPDRAEPKATVAKGSGRTG